MLIARFRKISSTRRLKQMDATLFKSAILLNVQMFDIKIEKFRKVFSTWRVAE